MQAAVKHEPADQCSPGPVRGAGNVTAEGQGQQPCGVDIEKIHVHVDSDDEEVEEVNDSSSTSSSGSEDDSEGDEHGDAPNGTPTQHQELADHGRLGSSEGDDEEDDSDEDEDSDGTGGGDQRLQDIAQNHGAASDADEGGSSSSDGSDSDSESPPQKSKQRKPQQASAAQRKGLPGGGAAKSHPAHWRGGREGAPADKPTAGQDGSGGRRRSNVEHKCYYCGKPGSHAELARCCSVSPGSIDYNCANRCHMQCAAQLAHPGLAAAGVWFCGRGRRGHPRHTALSYLAAVNGGDGTEPCEMARRVVAHVYRRAELPLDAPGGKFYEAGEAVVARARGLVVDPERPGRVTFAALLGPPAALPPPALAPPQPAIASLLPPHSVATATAAAAAAAAAPPAPSHSPAAAGAAVVPPCAGAPDVPAKQPAKRRQRPGVAGEEAAARARAEAQADERVKRLAKRQAAMPGAVDASGAGGGEAAKGQQRKRQRDASPSDSRAVKLELDGGDAEAQAGVTDEGRHPAVGGVPPATAGTPGAPGAAARKTGEWRRAPSPAQQLGPSAQLPSPPAHGPGGPAAAGGSGSPVPAKALPGSGDTDSGAPSPSAAATASPLPQLPQGVTAAATLYGAVPSTPRDSQYLGDGGGQRGAGASRAEAVAAAAGLERQVQELRAALMAAERSLAVRDLELRQQHAKEMDDERLKRMVAEVRVEAKEAEARFWEAEARRQRERADVAIVEGAEQRGRAVVLEQQVQQLMAKLAG